MPAACVNGRPSGALAAATHAARTGLFLAERALPTRIERVRYRTVPASGVGHAIASAGAGDGGESPARQSSAESGERSRGRATRAAGADAPEAASVDRRRYFVVFGRRRPKSERLGYVNTPLYTPPIRSVAASAF